ncbi:hypothetical protein BC828DRAFT_387490 [Blastocladiella britannica]|nr:hypothetical protein BC828DRAFT_387490 [Blastocladiella britannica]
MDPLRTLVTALANSPDLLEETLDAIHRQVLTVDLAAGLDNDDSSISRKRDLGLLFAVPDHAARACNALSHHPIPTFFSPAEFIGTLTGRFNDLPTLNEDTASAFIEQAWQTGYGEHVASSLLRLARLRRLAAVWSVSLLGHAVGRKMTLAILGLFKSTQNNISDDDDAVLASLFPIASSSEPLSSGHVASLAVDPAFLALPLSTRQSCLQRMSLCADPTALLLATLQQWSTSPDFLAASAKIHEHALEHAALLVGQIARSDTGINLEFRAALIQSLDALMRVCLASTPAIAIGAQIVTEELLKLITPDTVPQFGVADSDLARRWWRLAKNTALPTSDPAPPAAVPAATNPSTVPVRSTLPSQLADSDDESDDDQGHTPNAPPRSDLMQDGPLFLRDCLDLLDRTGAPGESTTAPPTGIQAHMAMDYDAILKRIIELLDSTPSDDVELIASELCHAIRFTSQQYDREAVEPLRRATVIALGCKCPRQIILSMMDSTLFPRKYALETQLETLGFVRDIATYLGRPEHCQTLLVPVVELMVYPLLQVVSPDLDDTLFEARTVTLLSVLTSLGDNSPKFYVCSSDAIDWAIGLMALAMTSTARRSLLMLICGILMTSHKWSVFESQFPLIQRFALEWGHDDRDPHLWKLVGLLKSLVL